MGTRSGSSHRAIPRAFDRRPRKSLFVAGFVENQMENQSLNAIVHDLLPYYYVSQNPTSTQSWTRATCREMVGAADAVIFFIHEASLSDKRCLLVLQTAWELMIPLMMLRHPRMKLLIKPRSKVNRSYLSHGGQYPDTTQHNEPDMDLLRDVLFEGYKESISYDRFQHNAGMKPIKHRLAQLFEPGSNGTNQISPHPSRANGTTNLKLPPIMNSRFSLRESRLILPPGDLDESIMMRKSQSMSSLSDDSLLAKGSPSQGQAKKKPRPKRKRMEKGQSVDKDSATGERKIPDNPLRLRSDINSLSSVTSLDDEALYHETKYLVFPVRDKSLKPTLINFPADLLGDREDLKLESIWGSESSLDEEFNRAAEVQGTIDLRSPSPPLAPFIDPI